jgi:DNA-binding transcriptional regulator LsrR (DeoR family)
MSIMESRRLVLKACQWSFREGLSNTEIAARLGMSRFQVARLIRRGLDEGYVVIKVLEPDRWHADLERELEQSFGVQMAIVVDDDGSADEVRRRVSDAAGRLLVDTVTKDMTIGISLGRAMQLMVEQLPDRIRGEVSVVQLIGGTPGLDSRHEASMLTAQLAARFDTRPALLYAPAVVSGSDVRTSLLNDSSIRATFDQFARLDIAFLGIGALGDANNSRLIYGGLLEEAHADVLRREGAVGDVLSYVFDARGRFVSSGLEDRVLAISLDDLLRVPRRIGVASGAGKVQAVAGALRGGLVNVLVTDSGVATSLCESEAGHAVS